MIVPPCDPTVNPFDAGSKAAGYKNEFQAGGRALIPKNVFGRPVLSFEGLRPNGPRPRAPVISNGASRLFLPASLLWSGRLAQRQISLPLSSVRLRSGELASPL